MSSLVCLYCHSVVTHSAQVKFVFVLLYVYFPLFSLLPPTSIGFKLILARYLELNARRLNLKCEAKYDGEWLIVLEVMKLA
jgi:hypothetical protein